MKKVGSIYTILPNSPVVPLFLNKDKPWFVFDCDCGALFCGWVLTALHLWREPRRRLRGLEMEMTGVKCDNLTLLCHFTGERDEPREENRGTDKRARGGLLGWGKESSTTVTELTNPGSGGPRADSTHPEQHPA